jgi:Tol biopolymer transport system component
MITKQLATSAGAIVLCGACTILNKFDDIVPKAQGGGGQAGISGVGGALAAGTGGAQPSSGGRGGQVALGGMAGSDVGSVGGEAAGGGRSGGTGGTSGASRATGGGTAQSGGVSSGTAGRGGSLAQGGSLSLVGGTNSAGGESGGGTGAQGIRPIAGVPGSGGIDGSAVGGGPMGGVAVVGGAGTSEFGGTLARGGAEAGGAETGGIETGGVNAGGLAGSAPELGTWRVSVSSTGMEGDGASYTARISGDGTVVVFRSNATVLIPDDTNGATDIFAHDYATMATVRVNVGSDGSEDDGSGSTEPAISSDGRFVAFRSYSANLVANDTNGRNDVFIKDRQTGGTARVSISSGNVEGDNDSYGPAVSSDGRYVTFYSPASTLVSGDTNGMNDIFVRDRQLATTTRVNLTSTGGEAAYNCDNPAISADGQVIAFNSTAVNLVANDTNAVNDVFVRDLQAGTTVRVSVASDGTESNGHSLLPSISADGRRIAFLSDASNLVPNDTNGVTDVFVRDLSLGTTRRVNVASDGSQASALSFSFYQSISGNGRFVAFDSTATNLVPNDTNGVSDIFVHDLDTGTTTRVSVTTTGAQVTGSSMRPALNSDGSWVAFESAAADLVTTDFNGAMDVFLRRWR